MLVLLDDYDIDNRIFSGRTYRDAPEIDNEVIVTHDGKFKAKPGDFVYCHITDASEYELYADYKVDKKLNNKIYDIKVV